MVHVALWQPNPVESPADMSSQVRPLRFYCAAQKEGGTGRIVPSLPAARTETRAAAASTVTYLFICQQQQHSFDNTKHVYSTQWQEVGRADGVLPWALPPRVLVFRTLGGDRAEHEEGIAREIARDLPKKRRRAMITAALFSLAVVAAAAPCSCPASVGGSALVTCRSSGDPHFTTWSGTRFDHQGLGVFQLAQYQTSCGCDITIQSFQGPSVAYRGAAINKAVAMRVGDTTLSALSSESVMRVVSGSSAAVEIPATESASSTSVGDVTVVREQHGNIWSWRVLLPGGGSLLILPTSHGGVETLFNLWVSIPSEVRDGAGGICSAPCAGGEWPSEYCSPDSADRCLRVFSRDALFSSAQLVALERCRACACTGARPPAHARARPENSGAPH